MDAGLFRYLPAMFPLVYQEIIYAVRTKKNKNYQLIQQTKDVQTLILNFLQINTSWSSVHICLATKIKSSTNEANYTGC